MASSLNLRAFSPCPRPYLPHSLSDVTPRKSQVELPGLNLKSSATLGTGRTSSHKEMFDRLEDKEVWRASKKTRLDPMIDQDSGDEEDYNIPPAGVTQQSRTSPADQTRRSRTPCVRSAAEDTRTSPIPATSALTALVTAAPASVGSALRKNADGSVAARKILPKRNKTKVKKTPPLLDYWLTFASLVPKLEAKRERTNSPSG